MCVRVFVCWVVFKPREARTLKLGVGRMNETFSVLRGTDPPPPPAANNRLDPRDFSPSPES